MITIFLRAVFVYLMLIAVLRVMGKRQIAQLQPYELVMTIAIADLASTPMSDPGVPLIFGVLPILALVIVNASINIACMKSEKVRTWVGGKPSVVIRNGKVDFGELHKLAYSMMDLSEQIRASGVSCIADVDTAVLETGGGLSVFPVAEKKPITFYDLNIPRPREGIPMTLVLDGQIQRKNLEALGCDTKWLERIVKQAQVDCGVQGLAYALVESDGTFIAQSRDMKRPIYRLEKAYQGGVDW